MKLLQGIGKSLGVSTLCLFLMASYAGQARAQADAPGYGSAPGKLGQPQSGSPVDNSLNSVRWEQKLDSQLPLDATFQDDTGKEIQLGSYFRSHRPVVLAMVFYNCTMLCNQVISGMMRSLKDVKFKPGTDYDVVVMSINPNEKPPLAASKKKNYLAEFGFTGTEDGWHFLTGTKDQIDRVTNAAGFYYAYDKTTDQFAHPGGILLITPEGKVTRYFSGIEYKPRDLTFSMIEASKSKIGSPVDLVLLKCFHYDPHSGKYTLQILQVLRLAGAACVILLGSCMAFWVRHDMKKSRLEQGQPEETPEEPKES